ncbi:thioredoxin family protein [Streptomyces asoensis]|uniref:thioredoxin family protein n=1 Tax=Streptomyces asoensis TaxID=249586 RepID=UPI0033DC162A
MNTNTHTPAPRPAPPRWRRLCRTAAVVLSVTLAAAPYASASPATSRPAPQEATTGATQHAGTEALAARAGGEVIEVTSTAQFHELLRSQPRVIAMFTAGWCGPCQNMTPDFEDLSTQYRNVTFLYCVDFTDNYDNEELLNEYGVRVLPTFIAFGKSREVKRMNGANPEALRKLVQELAAR